MKMIITHQNSVFSVEVVFPLILTEQTKDTVAAQSTEVH